MGTVHVIASRYGGAVIATIPASELDPDHPDSSPEDRVAHERFLRHVGHDHVEVTEHDAEAIPALDPAHVLRDGGITAMGHVSAASALAAQSAATALIARQQAIIESLARRLDALEGKRTFRPAKDEGS